MGRVFLQMPPGGDGRGLEVDVDPVEEDHDSAAPSWSGCLEEVAFGLVRTPLSTSGHDVVRGLLPTVACTQW